MTVRDVVLHSHAIITSDTWIKLKRGYEIIAEGTKYDEPILALGDRKVSGLIWHGASGRADILVDDDE